MLGVERNLSILPWELLPLISLDRCLEESCWLLVNAGEGLLGTDGTLNDNSLLSLEPPTWCPSECSKGPLGILGLSKSISGLGRSQSILCLEIQNNSSNNASLEGKCNKLELENASLKVEVCRLQNYAELELVLCK